MDMQVIETTRDLLKQLRSSYKMKRHCQTEMNSEMTIVESWEVWEEYLLIKKKIKKLKRKIKSAFKHMDFDERRAVYHNWQGWH